MTEKKNKEFTCTLDLRVKPEDDRRGGNSHVGHDRKEEQGRSMVEMLGVLAVVGVLSVGGIAGYTYAMNKHYANELLNGASQRAVILKSQKAAGLPLSLREFDGVEVAGGTFESVEELEDGSGFIIPVSGVKGAVCENLIKATEDTEITIVQKAEDNTLTDLTAENCDDENDNNLAFVFKTGNGESAEENNTVCSSWTTNECGEGYYCQFSPSGPSSPGTGICTEITGDTIYNGMLIGPEGGMDWWSANSWCIGKKRSGLFDIAEWDCNASGNSCSDYDDSLTTDDYGNYWLDAYRCVSKGTAGGIKIYPSAHPALDQQYEYYSCNATRRPVCNKN